MVRCQVVRWQYTVVMAAPPVLDGDYLARKLAVLRRKTTGLGSTTARSVPRGAMASVVVDRFRVTAVRTKAAACKTRSRTSEYQAHHVKYTDAFDRLRQSWIDELQQGAEAGRNANPTVGAAPGRWRAGLARYCRTKSFDLRPVIRYASGARTTCQWCLIRRRPALQWRSRVGRR